MQFKHIDAYSMLVLKNAGQFSRHAMLCIEAQLVERGLILFQTVLLNDPRWLGASETNKQTKKSNGNNNHDDKRKQQRKKVAQIKQSQHVTDNYNSRVFIEIF